MANKIHASSIDEVIERNWPEGFKKTRQRVDIFRVLYQAKQPVSASEIYDDLNKDHSDQRYAFSTVYRNLLAFEKAGIVVKSILTTEENAIYELKHETHRHYAICLLCHVKMPIKSCPLHHISHDIEESIPGFQITGHRLEIYGYCEACKKTLA